MVEGDGLPALICLSCNHLLDVSYEFICQIQNSDVRLRQILKLQIQSTLQEKHVKDDTAMIIKDIADVVSDVVSCKKDNVIEQDIYSHDIITYDGTAIQSDAVISDESHISHKCMQKTEEIIEPSTIIEKDASYGTLKENVHKAEIMEVAMCHEDDAATDHSDQLSSSTRENKCVKQEQLMIPENNEMSGSLTDENREDMLKIEVKNDMLLEDFNDHDVSKETAVLRTDNEDARGIANCSDDEEKPLISRTTRQKCPHCIKSFATRVALQRHMNVHKHKTKLCYVCVVCDKLFSSIDKMKSHMLTCHETQVTDSKASQNDKRASKVSAKVTRSGNVIDNTREEKKNFKFTCKVCSKQFIYQKSFLSHAKTHAEYNVNTSDDVPDQPANKTTGEQKDRMLPMFRENESEEEEEEEDDDDSDLPIESLQCTQCGKLFATKRNLKRHISTHSGLKFNCSTCGKGFSRIDKLKDHEQSKHKEEIFGNTDDEDDDEEDNESKINENSENRKKASLFYMTSKYLRTSYIFFVRYTIIKILVYVKYSYKS